jgi:hypothetical protein
MQRLAVRRSLALILAASTVASVSLTASARQDAKPADPAPQPVQTMLVAERVAGMEFFVSPKDKALAEALSMLPLRLRELREQVPDFKNIPEPVLNLLPRLVAHPARIAITNKGFDQQTGMPGIGAIISFKCVDEGDAKDMHAAFNTIREMSQMPFEPADSAKFKGMTDLPLPMGVLSYGPRQADDGWRYEFLFAAVDNPDAPFAALPKPPAGTSTTIRGKADLAAWSPIISMFAGFVAMGSPQGQNVMKELREAGILGSDAISVDGWNGYNQQGAAWQIGVRKAGKYADAWGTSRSPLTAAELGVVPADATFAQIKRGSISHMWNSLKQQMMSAPPAAEQFKETLAQFTRFTGLDVETDLVAAMGDTTVLYFSDSTGGGSLFSGVAMQKLADPAKMIASLDKLAAAANKALRENVEPPVQIELARFKEGGASYTQLRFPGLPVPIEPTIAVVGDWLLVGATPQAAMLAARHIAGKSAGLADNASFKSSRWALPGDVQPISLTFIDTPRTIADGYATMTLLGSAITNLARSSTTAAKPRDPGMVLPPLSELRAGAKPMTAVAYWAGEDLIFEARGDASVLVNITGLLGVGDAAPLVGGLIIGSAIGSEAAKNAGQHAEDHEDHGQDEADQQEHDSDGDKQEEPAKKRDTPY